MSKAKNYPLQECADRALELVLQGATVFQKFTCAHCGARQTMPDANKFYIGGICEECGGETDISKDGCNYMVIWTV